MLGAFGLHVDETAALKQQDDALVVPFFVVLRVAGNGPLGEGRSAAVLEDVSLSISYTPTARQVSR